MQTIYYTIVYIGYIYINRNQDFVNKSIVNNTHYTVYSSNVLELLKNMQLWICETGTAYHESFKAEKFRSKLYTQAFAKNPS